MKCSDGCIGDELAVDDVGQAPTQAAHRFHRRYAVGEAAPVVAGARSVGAQLHEPGHVEHVVEPPVAGSRQAVADVLAAGGVDWRGAGLGREVAAVGEAGDVADVGEDPDSKAPALICRSASRSVSAIRSGHRAEGGASSVATAWRSPTSSPACSSTACAVVAVRAGSPTPRNAAEAKPASVSARWRRSARTVPDRSSGSRSPLRRHAPQRIPPAG